MSQESTTNKRRSGKTCKICWNGTGWVYKPNPSRTAITSRTRMRTKRGEGLKQKCSAKVKKEGTAGRMENVFVAVAYGKCIIRCH